MRLHLLSVFFYRSVFRRCVILFSCSLVASVCAAEKPGAGVAAVPASVDDHSIDDHTLAIHFIQPIFETLDCENVGRIQTGDAGEHITPLFSYKDSDHSRTLNQQEFIGKNPKRPDLDAAVFRKIDSNGDGQLSDREYIRYVDTAIRTIDRNGDGEASLVEAELAAPSPSPGMHAKRLPSSGNAGLTGGAGKAGLTGGGGKTDLTDAARKKGVTDGMKKAAPTENVSKNQ